MPIRNTHKEEITPSQQGLFSNTGYRRRYDKTDKVDSCYFEVGAAGSADLENILHVGVQVPPDVEDIEKWLLGMLKKAGYRSLKELMVRLDLPEKEAVLIQLEEPVAETVKQQALDIIRNVIILSRCNRVGYHPGSPMIFSHSRINRTVSLVTIDLKSFYELD